MAHLKLKEIVWELCGKCKNGCKFCGSKSVWNENIDEEKIISIAKKISEYPPEEINISGGDPLLVSTKTHEDITSILKKKKVICKIVISPKSLKEDNSEILSILKNYDHIGISINEKKDMDLAKKINHLKNITYITNFNLENIFLSRKYT